MSQFDLTTKEGIAQTRRYLAEKRRNDAISEFHAGIEAEQDTEALEDKLKEIELLNEFRSERPRPSIVQWEDIPDIDRKWLIHDWMPENTVTMFTGDGGAGKSWLTLQAVCQIATGYRDAFLNPDFQTPGEYDDSVEPKQIVFATYEDEPTEIKSRLHQLASGMPWIAEAMDTIKRNLHIVDMRGIGSVWGPGVGKHIANTGDLLGAGEDLRAICENEDIKASLLVLDPLSGAFGGNENDRTAVYDFVSSFRGWGDTAKCAMLVIGHLPKGEEAKKSGFSGSTAWEASARSMWMLSKKDFTDEKDADKEEKHYWALEHTKSNYARLQDEIPLCKQSRGWFTQAESPKEAANAYEAYQAGTPRGGRNNDNGIRFDL